MEELKINIQLKNEIKLTEKFWGDKLSVLQTFLCLHGREDNAGTFDRLIPLLPRQFSYLAIDLPGHGHSSRYPNGVFYYAIDFAFIINQIIDFYSWKRVSIIAHSLSSRLSFIYASIFPHRVDMVVAIDVLTPQIFEIRELRNYVRNFDKFYLTDLRNMQGEEPPSFAYDKLVERLHEGSYKSVAKEVAHHLLERGIKESKKYPGKFCFSRDRRMSFVGILHLPQDTQIELAKNLTMPYLFIQASNSYFKGIYKKHQTAEILNVLKKHPNFEHHMIDSNSHHFHLSEAEKVIGIIKNFIEKYKVIKNHL